MLEAIVFATFFGLLIFGTLKACQVDDKVKALEAKHREELDHLNARLDSVACYQLSALEERVNALQRLMDDLVDREVPLGVPGGAHNPDHLTIAGLGTHGGALPLGCTLYETQRERFERRGDGVVVDYRLDAEWY